MVVRISQKAIHSTNVDDLDEQLLACLQEGNRPAAEGQKILFDLAKVEYIFSQFLEVLLKLRKVLLARQGKLALCNLGAVCREVIETTHLHQLIPVFDTEEEAVRALVVGQAAGADFLPVIPPSEPS